MQRMGLLLSLAGACLVAASTIAVAQPSQQSAGRSPADLAAAHRILETNGVAPGEYRIKRLVRYDAGGGMIWVDPTHRGLPLFHSERAFHFDSVGRLKLDKRGKPLLGGEGHDLSRLELDITPQVTAQQAGQTFARESRSVRVPGPTGGPGHTVGGPACAGDPEQHDTELGIYFPAWERQPVLAWQVRCRGRTLPVAYVSADKGNVLMFDSGVRSAAPGPRPQPPRPDTRPLPRTEGGVAGPSSGTGVPK